MAEEKNGTLDYFLHRSLKVLFYNFLAAVFWKNHLFYIQNSENQ